MWNPHYGDQMIFVLNDTDPTPFFKPQKNGLMDRIVRWRHLER